MTDVLKDLAEASFNGVIFPVEMASTDGGQRLVEHEALLRRGADVEMTGQRPYSGSLTIPFINTATLTRRYGEMFPAKRFDVLAAFESSRIGTLTHPTYGTFQAAIKSWRETLEADTRNGCRWVVEWVEHNGQASNLLNNAAQPPVTSLNSVNTNATAANDLMAASGQPFAPVQPLVSEKLDYLEAQPRTFSEVSDAFRQMLQPVQVNLGDPVFAQPGTYSVLRSLLDLRAQLYALESLYRPTAEQVRLYTLPVDMSLWQVSLAVYGDATRTQYILGANAISNPLVIGAGTVLTILPVEA